jgi:membrane-associated phospholipid phosphatase
MYPYSSGVGGQNDLPMYVETPATKLTATVRLSRLVMELRRRMWPIVGLMTCFVGLVALCWHRHGPSSLDTALLHGYVPAAPSALFRVARVVTEIASPPAVIVLGVASALLIWRSSKLFGWTLACILGPGAAGIAESVMKLVVARPRPVVAALTGEDGNGFPSGHVTGFTAFVFIAGAAYVAIRAKGSPVASHVNGSALASLRVLRSLSSVVLPLNASVLIAFTRVLVGAHYPTDVVAGLCLGLAVAVTTIACVPMLESFVPTKLFIKHA